ncbi:MAG: endonuclease/exonuclease/phosphatase family protein [Clostridia bacterium]|nr:endonuclease/exonuclease/phosphatase family protein [Clostridia bacterium]
MKIMTSNIQHALDYQNQIIDTDLFVNAIRLYGADICNLNEVRGKGPIDGYTNQTDAIADGLGFFRHFGEAVKVEGTSPYGNAIVSRLPFKSCETVAIPEVADKSEDEYHEPRCVIKAIIEINGTDICLMNCHMGLSDDERNEAVKKICELIDATDLPIILTGDFNTAPDDTVLKPIYDRLSDSDENAINKGMYTYASYLPEIKIDYIFYRNLECLYSEVITEIYSDHFPIIAEFRTV